MLSVTRVALIMLPAAALLQAEWGVHGVFAAELVANLGGGLLAALLVLYLFRPGQAQAAPKSAPGPRITG